MQSGANSASGTSLQPPVAHNSQSNARAFRPLRCLFLAFSSVALVFALCRFASEKGVATDLYSLAGDDGRLIGALAQKTADEIRVLCADGERAAKCREAFPFRESPDPSQLLDFFQTHGSGLLSDKTRALLEAGEYDRIRRGVRRRDYMGAGLFPKAADPYYFLSDYVAGLKSLMPKGLSGGRELLTASVKGREGDLAKLISLAENDDGVFLSGAPFHTFLATDKSKREINILGGVSLAVILIVGLMLFRSPRFILPTAIALAFGFLVGAATVFVFFARPHILTFLFGSTLVGLGVDYCYHSLAENGEKRKLVRSLSAALVTTALAFSPLLFSSVSVLNQMAAFTISGLVAIWAIAVSNDKIIPARNINLPEPDLRRWKLPVFLAYLAVFVATAAGWQRIATANDPASFYKPPELLAKGEANVAETVGCASAFAVVSAPTLEEALVKEEAAGVAGVSKILPSLARQRHNARLAADFAGVPPAQSFVTLESLPPSLRTLADAMILEHGGKTHLISPADGVDVRGVEEISPKEALEEMFSRFSAETTLLILASFAMMAIALLVMYQRLFFSYVAPVCVAVLMTAGALGWMGEKITFFHTLCFFVMTGIGIDYVIFSMAGSPADKLACATSRRSVVFASFLTSLAGFGALGFTSFPPTRAMGTTLAIGLFFCYILSLVCKPSSSAPANSHKAEPSNWAEREERGATRLGILVIWHIYRLFGKTAAKIAFLAPLSFIAPFCRGAGWRKILSFAWSRIDIVDAVTLRKNIPRITLSGDTGWRDGGAFLISSHLGSIEVLAALCDPSRPMLHAFQQVSHNPVFTGFLAERMNGFSLHAVEDIGVETAVEMKAALARGELVLMAGDRVPARRAPSETAGRRRSAEETRQFLGAPRAWPRGVFRFAKLMESPVYAIVAVRTGWNAYEVKAVRLGADLLDEYVAFLEAEVRRNPCQWFEWEV